jgi:DivIVA domain-containing protein
MRKKDTGADGASEWSSVAPGRITPLDVQQKEFHVTRVGAGYRMREVDEFLDQVTDALSALIAENERLLRAAGSDAPTPSAASAAPAAAADDADRAAVEAFLRREKGFLQDLGGLVQAHAEELRSMVRAVRRDATGTAAAAAAGMPVGEPPASASAPAPAAGPPPAPATLVDAPGSATAEEPAPEAPATPAPGTVEGADEPAGDGSDGEDEAGRAPTAIAGEAADEPIRLEEPEPARSHPSEETEGDSLRELFWGEE